MEKKEPTMEEEPFPYIPKDLYERLKKDFDIRKLITYTHTRDELMGTQAVINYLDWRYQEQTSKGVEE